MSTEAPLLAHAPTDPAAGAPGSQPPPAVPDDPSWTRPAYAVLLVATAALYLWDLGASGWANSFYAAAAQAGSVSWKAFFFGASDAAGSITVDKTPLSLWPMALSIRLFGLSSWSLLVPQALMGVGSVALLAATVRRTTRSAVAGLIASTVLALTPVAVLMFRFDNPDALLVLLLIGAVAATLRAVESSGLRARGLNGHPVRWLALAGALMGLAYLTKMLQAFLVLPALAAVYLLAAQTPLGRRVGHLLVAFGSMLLAAGWWVAIVELWPASARPYIGGSQHNSILELTFGYNGFGRLTGAETGSVGGAPGGGWGATGILRLFGSEVGGQIAWLLPAALLLLGSGLWVTRRAPRKDAVRAGLVVWGLWLVVTGLTFSFMAGIFHAYYTVALAPAIAALVGIGAEQLWRRRESVGVTLTLATTVLATTVTAFVLLAQAPDYLPWLKWVLLVVGTLTAATLAVGGSLRRSVALTAGVAALLVGLAGPTAYSFTTAATPHTGSIVTAGPITGAAGGFGRPGFQGGPPGGTPPQGAPQRMPQGAPPTGTQQGVPPAGSQQGAAGGLLDSSTPSAALTRLLDQDASSYEWVAAAVGTQSAAGYQLATQHSVMPIGGFNGSDPSPTRAQFQEYVAQGRIHWFIAGGGFGGGPGGNEGTGSAISTWVQKHFHATTVGGVTVYDLSGGAQ